MQAKKIRLKVIQVVFIVLFVIVLYRLVDLQIIQGQNYRETALKNRLRVVTLESKRGDIYDRNMNSLATSTHGASVAAFPAEIKGSKYDVEQMATQLSVLLHVDVQVLLDKLQSDQNFVWLKRKIDFSAGPAIKKLDFPGIELYQESQRYYPKGKLASQTIGFAGIDNQGLAGLEVTYDELLLGEPGKVSIEMDLHNREIPQSMHSYQPPSMGKSLVTTIDEKLQYLTEKNAASLLISTEAEGVTILMMDIKNGEILSMVSVPDFEPANYGDYAPSTWLNGSIQSMYEPGSTFKIISAAALLELGVVKPTDSFYCSGYKQVGGLKIRCWRYRRPHGQENFMEAFGNSCNPVFVEASIRARTMDKNQLFDMYNKLGFGHKTGMEFTGQARGLMPQENGELYVATSAIGQGIAVSPVQLAAAIASVLGDGTKIEPVIVSAVLDENKKTVERFTGRTEERILSMETVETMRAFMEHTVQEGTASTGKVEGYRVGGKTGTAQKPSESGGYYKDKFITSFVSVGPMEDPSVLTLVIVDAPRDPDASGSSTAGPTAALLLEEALKFKGIKPHHELLVEAEGKASESSTNEMSLTIVPDVQEQLISEAVAVLKEAGLEARFERTGSRVASQSIEANKKVETGTVVELTMYQDILKADEVIVPNLIGMRVFQALEILDELELYLQVQGNGNIISQYPEADHVIKKKATINVVCGKE